MSNWHGQELRNAFQANSEYRDSDLSGRVAYTVAPNKDAQHSSSFRQADGLTLVTLTPLRRARQELWLSSWRIGTDPKTSSVVVDSTSCIHTVDLMDPSGESPGDFQVFGWFKIAWRLLQALDDVMPSELDSIPALEPWYTYAGLARGAFPDEAWDLVRGEYLVRRSALAASGQRLNPSAQCFLNVRPYLGASGHAVFRALRRVGVIPPRSRESLLGGLIRDGGLEGYERTLVDHIANSYLDRGRGEQRLRKAFLAELGPFKDQASGDDWAEAFGLPFKPFVLGPRHPDARVAQFAGTQPEHFQVREPGLILDLWPDLDSSEPLTYAIPSGQQADLAGIPA
jgi:hypothetical protein